MRAYVSSTFLDLEDCREQVLRALSRIRVQGVAMESYVAAPDTPLERCLRDVAECDFYIGVFAWRYGYIPRGQDASITELEYRQAVKLGKPTLIFLLNEDAAWPPNLVDRDRSRIVALRAELAQDRLCSFFSSPQELAALVTAAVYNLLRPANTDSIARSAAPKGALGKTPEVMSRKGRSNSAVKVTARDLVFISYSHDDSRLLKELQIHLEPYIRNVKVSVWDDTKIGAGAIWRESIGQALASAKVAVLLVSPAFLASRFIADEELPQLLEAAKNEGMAILWIPARSSSFEVTPIAAYQAAHSPNKPLASLSRAARDKALVNICAMIRHKYQQ